MLNALRICLALVLAIPFNIAEARIIGTNPTGTSSDLWCNGGRIRGNTTITASEICQDSNGNWIPTTTATQSIGTSSFQWNNAWFSGTLTTGPQIQTGNDTVNGNQTVSGSVTAGAPGTAATLGNGNLTGSSPLTILGTIVVSPTQIGNNGTIGGGIYVSTTIPVLSSYETLTSSATNSGLITITATPSISTLTVVGSLGGQNIIPGGTYLILGSTAPTNGGGIILQDNGTLSGSKLHLGASTRQIGPDKVLTLIWESVSGFWEEVSYANNN